MYGVWRFGRVRDVTGGGGGVRKFSNMLDNFAEPPFIPEWPFFGLFRVSKSIRFVPVVLDGT